MSGRNNTFFMSDKDFTQMERLLGSLLIEATDRETELVLQLHERLLHIRQRQDLKKARLERLTALAG